MERKPLSSPLSGFFIYAIRHRGDAYEKMAKQGKDVTPSDYEELLKKVSELESKLKHETLRADFYEEMVAFGKEVYGIDLKKAGTK